ncbi:flavin oxidoreductase/NADH oxidase, partial [bacterium]|nr:flavin oxidoreductase/NADH oxidase [bacterium]
DSTVRGATNRSGSDGKPFTVLQLTHSGRYSRPESAPAPVCAVKNPYLDTRFSEDVRYRIITDDELEELEDHFADAAILAGEIGFDAVDIKSCHGYLIADLLSAREREGRYGGSFENRTRFLLNIIDKITARTNGELAVTVRLGAYDAVPFPYGWGVDDEDERKNDISEPVSLVKLLAHRGVNLINVTAGNPYYNPHIGRPYDTGPYVPREHPLYGVERMLAMSREIQKAVPGMAVISTGLSWLREFGAHCAAGGIREGWFAVAGFGRQAFAYPYFPRDILARGQMERKKCCITCGKCSEIMRYGGRTGCVIRDAAVYFPIYRQVSEGKSSLSGSGSADHV